MGPWANVELTPVLKILAEWSQEDQMKKAALPQGIEARGHHHRGARMTRPGTPKRPYAGPKTGKRLSPAELKQVRAIPRLTKSVVRAYPREHQR
jgi:hypothetical protein